MKKVSKIQEHYLRLMTSNYELSYEELFELTKEISPQQRCLNSLITEVYKCLMDFHLQFPNTGTILDTTSFS